MGEVTRSQLEALESSINARLILLEQALSEYTSTKYAEKKRKDELPKSRVSMQLQCKSPAKEIETYWDELMKDETFSTLVKCQPFLRSTGNWRAEKFWWWLTSDNNQSRYWLFYQALYNNPSLRPLLPPDVKKILDGEAV